MTTWSVKAQETNTHKKLHNSKLDAKPFIEINRHKKVWQFLFYFFFIQTKTEIDFSNISFTVLKHYVDGSLFIVWLLVSVQWRFTNILTIEFNAIKLNFQFNGISAQEKSQSRHFSIFIFTSHCLPFSYSVYACKHILHCKFYLRPKKKERKENQEFLFNRNENARENKV